MEMSLSTKVRLTPEKIWWLFPVFGRITMWRGIAAQTRVLALPPLRWHALLQWPPHPCLAVSVQEPVSSMKIQMGSHPSLLKPLHPHVPTVALHDLPCDRSVFQIYASHPLAPISVVCHLYAVLPMLQTHLDLRAFALVPPPVWNNLLPANCMARLAHHNHLREALLGFSM